MAERPDGHAGGLAARALERMGYELYELAAGGVRPVSGSAWAREAGLPESSLFLEEYFQRVAEAEELREVEPAIWRENERGLEAFGVEVDGNRLVAVRDLGEEFEARRQLVQRANEESLNRRSLLKEIQKKEMLLRCIVHDLGNPLATVIMNLQRAERIIEEPKALWSVQTALVQAVRQRSMIRSVIDVFAAEIAALEEFDFDPLTAPDAVAVVQAILEAHNEVALRGGLRLRFDDGGLRSAAVRAEGALLERVIENLLANAVRHGGVDSEVVIRLADRDGRLEISVEDEGPGIPAGMERAIFDPFVQSGAAAGQSGLGLFFCKRSVRRWGGEIGCENREAGGARFWIRLDRAPPSDATGGM